MDEVFGSENFVSQITFKKTSGAGSPTYLDVALVATTCSGTPSDRGS